MRLYKLSPNDTLYKIACKKYYVYDDQGDEDSERVAIVAREIVKWNQCLSALLETNNAATQIKRDDMRYILGVPLQPDASACAAPILLPNIPGIPAYEADHWSERWWKTFYWRFWLAGIAVGLFFYLVQQYFLQTQDLESWTKTQVLEYIRAPYTFVSAVLPRVVLWSLATWALWSYFRPITSTPVRQLRLRYFVGWIVGLIALIPGLYLLLTIVVPRAAPTLSQFSDLFPLLVIWSILIFLLYLYLGDGSDLHREYLVPHQGIWTVFTLILLGTILAGYTGYQQVNQRIEGELGALTMAQTAVQQMHDASHSVVDTVTDLAQKKGSTADGPYIAYIESKWPEITLHGNSAAMYAKHAQASIQDALTVLKESAPSLTATDYVTEQVHALNQVSTILTATTNATTALTEATEGIEQLFGTTLLTETKAYSISLVINRDLLRLARHLDMQTEVADNALSGIKTNGLSLFLWNGVLYAVLVLFPWLLLLLFLYRKRSRLAAQIYMDLLRLDQEKNLLRRALAGSNTRHEREVKQAGMANGKPQSSGDLPVTVAQQKPTAPDPSTHDHKSDHDELIDLVAERTFSGFEYLLSLTFLSLLVAVGWYYVFYPQTSLGLASLIKQGAGVRELSGFIAENLTPLTMGFAGAYFFLMQMLVRRYLSADLYPSAFLQAAQRLLLVFMLSLALAMLPFLSPTTETEGIHWSGTLLIIFAFLVGIYPTSGVQLLITLVNRQLKRAVFPATLVPEPITKLSGVTIWIEARLFEENIESIEAMATAPIERLVVGTHFPAAQIVDWIDQAILYLHAGHNGEWFPQLRAVGIRGASDLLDVAGLNLNNPRANLLRPGRAQTEQGDFIPDEGLLNQVVEAIMAANASGVPEPDPNDPRGAARLLVDQLVTTVDTTTQTAMHVHTLIAQIDMKTRLSFDYVQPINVEVEKVNAFLHTLLERVAGIEQTVDTVSDAETKRKLQEAGKELKAIAEATATQTLAYQPIAVSAPPHPLTLQEPDQVDQAKGYLTEVQLHFSQLAIKLDAIIALTNQPVAGNSAQASVALQTAATELLVQIEAAQDQVKSAQKRAEGLNIKQPATLDARVALTEATKALEGQVGSLQNQLTTVQDALTSKAISKTEAQKRTIERALADVQSAVAALPSPTLQANQYADALLHLSAAGTAGQAPSKATVQEIHKPFETAQSQIKTLRAATGTITVPPQLTVAVLRTMCDAIWPAPNLPYILNFYQQSCKDLVNLKDEKVM